VAASITFCNSSSIGAVSVPGGSNRSDLSTMVKCRQTTVKASPLPVIYRIKTSHDGAQVIRRFSAIAPVGTEVEDDRHQQDKHEVSGAVRSNRSVGTASTTGKSKRSIFPHLTRLHHGILRYRNVAESPTSVAATTTTGNDRHFVFVPAGYTVQDDRSLHEILTALGLHGLPPLVIVTAATNGAVEETVDEDMGTTTIQDEKNLLLDKSVGDLDLTEEEERELLREKTHEILKSTVDLCAETGAWLLPHRPRRANGAAEILCGVVSTATQKNDAVVILGMIGLDQQDQKDGFTESITSHMRPVGTEINKVADVSYDNGVSDNTPCPGLTHMLLFQRRHEMRDFRERLLSRTPDVFMAFGSTTPYAKKCLFASLIDQSPVALITHTSPEIDHMSLMLRHADREMRKISVGVVDPPEKGTALFAVSREPSEYETLPLSQCTGLQQANPELAEFLSVWPAAHQDERVVLADPRRVSGLRFQMRLLRAVNAAYYTPEARTIALVESSRLLTSIRSVSLRKKKVTQRYHLTMVVATLSAIVASVMYAKIYGENPAPSWGNRNSWQIVMFLLTIGVPIFIVYLKKCYDQNSQQWSFLQREAAQLESTLFEFRTHSRTFGKRHTAVQGSPEPLDAFIRCVYEIYTRAAPFLKDYALENTVSATGQSTLEKDIMQADDHDIEANHLPTESSPLIPPAPSPSLNELVLNGSTNKWIKKSRNAGPRENGTFKESGYIQDEPLVSGPNDDDQLRCGTSLLTIKAYVECRIHAGQQRKIDELESLEKRNKTVELIIKVVLVSTSLLALLSKQWFVPVVLGVSAAFVASQDFRKYRARVEHGKAMLQKLDELLSWWDNLEIEEKIIPSNEDHLVELAERIFVEDVSYTY
jgi:hypothetical protein